jgi:signal transduction histidine kinase
LWAERLHEDDRDRVLAALAQRGRTGRLSVEYRWQCADGSFKHFHDQAVLLRDAQGRPLEFAGTLTDVTERRSLESQLVQAQKMDAIGKLTGGIAHDFNNLLAAVLGGLGLLERRANLEEDELKILSMTKRAADQGTDLVRRLLAFARKQQLEPRAMDLHQLHVDVDELLRHTLGGLVELDWQMSADPVCVFADPSQLELALMNLIINARDAMPEGGTIVIQAEQRTIDEGDREGLSPGDYVCLRVTDTGTGIAPELLDKVLEPFFTTKQVGKGTGLGLSMVYGFAKQSGGTFVLRSTVGRGTSAELWLPRSIEGANAEAAREPKVAAPTDSLRILLVDDHPEVRRVTAGMLEELGHQVVESESGPQALLALGETGPAFDLLVSDYAMPQMTGTELVRRAREIVPDMPALIISGYADANEISERPSGVTVLQKPFTLAQLSHGTARPN